MKKPIRYLLLYALFFIIIVPSPCDAADNSKLIREGNRFYDRNEFDKALERAGL